MRFLADENIPPEIVSALRNAGHDVLDVKEEEWQGKTDIALVRIAQTQQRLILTHDKDFLQHRATRVILLRFYNQRPAVVIPYLLAFLKSKILKKLGNGTIAILSEQKAEFHHPSNI